MPKTAGTKGRAPGRRGVRKAGAGLGTGELKDKDSNKKSESLGTLFLIRQSPRLAVSEISVFVGVGGVWVKV